MEEHTAAHQKNEPRLRRPSVPAGYGIPAEIVAEAGIAWDRARERLAGSRNYWVMPVWGLWLEDAFYFSTSRRSRKGLNLASTPQIAMHLESGDDVVILEGLVAEVDDPGLLARFVDAYDAKYHFRPDATDTSNGIYQLRPRLAFSWLEQDFPQTAARWRFHEL